MDESKIRINCGNEGEVRRSMTFKVLVIATGSLVVPITGGKKIPKKIISYFYPSLFRKSY